MKKREVRCVCGAINRVPSYGLHRRPKCGACKTLLDEPFPIKALRIGYRHRTAGLSVVVGLLGLVLWRQWAVSSAQPAVAVPTTKEISETLPVISDVPAVDCSKLSQPRQGVYESFDNSPRRASLTIKTEAGSNYFVKLEDAANGYPILSFFIYGGTALERSVPLGNFVIHYASGHSWCGTSEMFGPDTEFSAAEETFAFTDGDRWTVELILQPGGNLRTRRISRSEF